MRAAIDGARAWRLAASASTPSSASVASSSGADGRVVRQGVRVDARGHGPQPEPRAAGEDPDAAAAAQRPQAHRARVPGSPRPCTARRDPRGRCRDGRRVPAPRASPWPSRCRGRGTPAANRRRRSPTGCRGRPAAPRARWRGRSCRSRSARRGRSAAPARRARTPRARAPRPGSGERAPERVRPAVLHADPHELADQRRRARDVDELALARPAGEVGDALGQVRERVA